VKLRNQLSLAKGKKNLLITWSLSNFPLSVPTLIASTMSYSMPTNRKKSQDRKSLFFE
jgi:hypothetical protein